MRVKRNATGDAFFFRRDVTCVHCASELEIEMGDLHSYSGLGNVVYYICPCCTGRNNIDALQLPLKVREAVRARATVGS